MYDDELMDAMFYETFDFEDDALMEDWAEFWEGDYDRDDWDCYEDPYNLDEGFDPYLGCYSDDC